MICARECPDWCIVIDAHTEPAEPAAPTGPAEPAGPAGPRAGRRERTRNVLDAFTIDFSQCMYCGICVEACPYDALSWAPSYDYPGGTRADLLHDIPRLAGWLGDVVPQPALDEGATAQSSARRRRNMV
jgi:NADH-quinone oxidoreductase subunit I